MNPPPSLPPDPAWRDSTSPDPAPSRTASPRPRSSSSLPSVHKLKPLPQADVPTVENLISQCNASGGKLAYTCRISYCKTPGKCFMSKENARVHVQHELGYKDLYACTGCSARFSSKDTAKRHVNSKMGGKRYACKYCGTRFERKDYRASHEFHQKCTPNRQRRREVRQAAALKLEEMEYRLSMNYAAAAASSFQTPSPLTSEPPSPISQYSPITPVDVSYPDASSFLAQPALAQQYNTRNHHLNHLEKGFYPPQFARAGLFDGYHGDSSYYGDSYGDSYGRALPQVYHQQQQLYVPPPPSIPPPQPPSMLYNQPVVYNTSRNIEAPRPEQSAAAFYMLHNYTPIEQWYRTV